MKEKFLVSYFDDGLITNQIALLLPIREQTEFGKMFGIDCRQFFFSPPPPHFTPTFLLTPGMLLPLLAFRSLVRSPPGKGKEWAATQATS